MTIYTAINVLNGTGTITVEEANSFLYTLSPLVQEQLIAAIYIGKDHVAKTRLRSDCNISREYTDFISKDEYPAILSKNSSEFSFYFAALKLCAENSGFDLNRL